MASFQVFRDDFDRTETSGWGQSPTPIIRTWANSAGLSVASGYGVQTGSSAVPSIETYVSLIDLALATSGEVIITAAVSATGTGYAYFQLKSDDFAHNSALILGFSSTVHPASITLINHINSDSATSGAGLSAATAYLLKWELSASQSLERARIWQASATEPGTWDVEVDLEVDFYYDALYRGQIGAVGTSVGASGDQNDLVGVVTRDASRHVGSGHPSANWANPERSNDGDHATYALVSSGLGGFTDYLVADLGATYRVTAYKIYSESGATYQDLPQWSTNGTTWNTPTYVETGGRASYPEGATLTFTSAIDARYW